MDARMILAEAAHEWLPMVAPDDDIRFDNLALQPFEVDRTRDDLEAAGIPMGAAD